MDYKKYAEEHKDTDTVNVKEGLEKAINMADKCSKMSEGMKPEMAPKVSVVENAFQIPEQKINKKIT